MFFLFAKPRKNVKKPTFCRKARPISNRTGPFCGERLNFRSLWRNFYFLQSAQACAPYSFISAT